VRVLTFSGGATTEHQSFDAIDAGQAMQGHLFTDGSASPGDVPELARAAWAGHAAAQPASSLW
jgi:hypothetical protein